MTTTRLTTLLGIEHPIMLAGMAPCSGPSLVAAVSNAGGFGTLGAAGLAPEGLKKAVQQIKALTSKPFGVDLLLPKVGGGAKATNKDYTGGLLHGLVDVMIEEQIKAFVCAVGVPPKEVVERLHASGILVMSAIGSPKHIPKVVAAGVDVVIASGTEGGGHTGAISTMVLVPQVADLCRQSGILVVAGGGIMDGRGIAAAMALGADGVWLGSRFLATPEANEPPEYKEALLKATSDDTIITRVYTGRTLRALKSPYIDSWMVRQHDKYEDKLARGEIPFEADARAGKTSDRQLGWFQGSTGKLESSWIDRTQPLPTRVAENLHDLGIPVGQGVGMLSKLEPAGEVVLNLAKELRQALGSISKL